MTDYKKKHLKYKTKYLKLLEKRKLSLDNKYNKIYGGMESSTYSETDVNHFIILLQNNIASLDKHANYFMFERDISHDFDVVTELGFTKYVPYGKAQPEIGLTPENEYLINKSNEHFHTLKYITNNDLDIFLYNVNKGIKFINGLVDINHNCYIDGINNCQILNTDDMNMPFNNSDKGYLYYDSGQTSHFCKFNLSWTNLFDPATTANKEHNLVDANSIYKIDLVNIEEFLNHKWQQVLIFSWYTKVGGTFNETYDPLANIFNLWPEAHNMINDDWYNNVNKELNSTIKKDIIDNYKLLYIAINILRLMHITINESKLTNGHTLVAQFSFRNNPDSVKFNQINEIIKNYNKAFRNPLTCFINHSDILPTDSEKFDLPISAADTFLAFISKTDWPSKKVRNNKEKNEKTIKMSNILIPIITNICEKTKLKCTKKQTKRVIMYIGLLLKYAIGDTTFILAQLYDKFLGKKPLSYLKSFDNFLNMRSLIFQNNIIGECNKNELFKLYKYKLDKSVDNLKNYLNDNNIFYSVKFELSQEDFIKELNLIQNHYLEDAEWYGTYDEFQETIIKNDFEERKEFFNDFKTWRKEIDEEFVYPLSEENIEIFKNFRTKFIKLNEIYEIFVTISKTEKNNDILIINKSDEEYTEFDEKLIIKINNFIYDILKLYDNRLHIDNQVPAIDMDSTDFKLGDGYKYSSPHIINLPLNEGNINKLEYFTNLFENTLNHLNLFYSIDKYKNMKIGKILKNKILKILNLGFTRKAQVIPAHARLKNISGGRNLGKFQDILLAKKYFEHNISIKEFIEGVHEIIFNNVINNNTTGWHQFSNIKSIFKNFYEIYDKFLDDYIPVMVQDGGTLDYYPLPTIIHRINPLLDKNKNLQELIGFHIGMYENGNFNINLTDIVINFIIDLTTNCKYKDKQGFEYDDKDVIPFNKLIKLNYFLKEFNSNEENQSPTEEVAAPPAAPDETAQQLTQETYIANENDYICEYETETYIKLKKNIELSRVMDIINTIIEQIINHEPDIDIDSLLRQFKIDLRTTICDECDISNENEYDININIYKKIITNIIRQHIKPWYETIRVDLNNFRDTILKTQLIKDNEAVEIFLNLNITEQKKADILQLAFIKSQHDNTELQKLLIKAMKNNSSSKSVQDMISNIESHIEVLTIFSDVVSILTAMKFINKVRILLLITPIIRNEILKKLEYEERIPIEIALSDEHRESWINGNTKLMLEYIKKLLEKKCEEKEISLEKVYAIIKNENKKKNYPLKNSFVKINFTNEDNQGLNTCKKNINNDCTKNINIPNNLNEIEEKNGNDNLDTTYEFFMMIHYLKNYLFKTNWKAAHNNYDNQNFYDKNLPLFNKYYKLYFGLYIFLNKQKDIDITDVYNSFSISLNMFIYDIIDLMFNYNILDIIISYINNEYNNNNIEMIKGILKDIRFNSVDSNTNVIQEFLIKHEHLVKTINLFNNNHDIESVNKIAESAISNAGDATAAATDATAAATDAAAAANDATAALAAAAAVDGVYADDASLIIAAAENNAADANTAATNANAVAAAANAAAAAANAAAVAADDVAKAVNRDINAADVVAAADTADAAVIIDDNAVDKAITADTAAANAVAEAFVNKTITAILEASTEITDDDGVDALLAAANLLKMDDSELDE
jgi:hypothetical protein